MVIGDKRIVGVTCKDCYYWTCKHDTWGICSIAKQGTFKHKRGYECNHTQAREYSNRACKVKFRPKEDS